MRREKYCGAANRKPGNPSARSSFVGGVPTCHLQAAIEVIAD
jgi:hypothetical protein